MLKHKKLLYLLIAEVIILLLLGFWVSSKQDTIVSQTTSADALELFALPRGTYKVFIDYTSASSDNAITFITKSNDESFLADTLQLYPWRSSDYLQLWVPHDFTDISIAYSEVDSLSFNQISIVATNDSRKMVWVVAFVLLLLLDGLYLWIRKIYLKSDDKRGTLLRFLLVIAGIVIASWPLHINRLIEGNDMVYHLARLESVAYSLAHGVFPVRISPYYLDGGGYASSIFYGDLFLYIPALLRIMGFTIMTSYKAFIVLINIFSALLAWFALSRILKSRWAASLAAFAYTLSLYRLGNIYIRAAVGEYSAMIFFPLVICGMYDLLARNNEQTKHTTGWLMLGSGMAGILMNHNISSILMVVSLVIWCLFYIRHIIRDRIFIPIAKAAVLAFGLSAFFLVPFADYMLTGSFNINATIQDASLIQDSGLNLLGFYNIVFEGSDMKTLGICILCLFLLYAIIYLRRFFQRKLNNSPYNGIVLILYTALILWMSSIYFPWNFLITNIPFIGSFATSIQFTFRFASIATVLCVLCGGLLIDELSQYAKPTIRNIFIVVFCCVIGVSSLVAINARHTHVSLYKIYDRAGLGLYRGYGTDQGYDINEGFYLPQGANKELFKDFFSQVPADESLLIDSYQQNGVRVTLHCQNNSDQDLTLAVPLVAYKGYQAWDSVSHNKLDVSMDGNALVTVTIPAGFDSDITIAFVEPWYWHVAEILSILSCLFLLSYCILYLKKQKI